MELKDYLVIFFIISAIVGVAISYEKLYLFHVLLALVLFYFITKVLKNGVIRYRKLPTNYHYFFYFMFVWYLLSIAWSLNVSYSIVYMVYIICGTFLSLTVVYYINTKLNLQRVYYVSAFVFMVLIIISLLEIFTNFRLPHSPLSSSINIASGFFGNQNNLAATMSIIFPFFLFHRSLVVKYLGCFTILVIVFSAFSRANILAIIFMIVFYIFVYKKNIRFESFLKGIVVLSVLILGFSIFNQLNSTRFISSEVIKSSFSTLERYANFQEIQVVDSVGIRQQLIINGLEALKDSYGIGVGGGASIYVQEQRSSTRNILNMHNFWIELLVDGGILFFSIFVIWYISLVKALFSIAWKSKAEIEKYFSSATSLSLIGFVPAAVSASSVIYLLPMWLLFGFAISIVNISKGAFFYARHKED